MPYKAFFPSLNTAMEEMTSAEVWSLFLMLMGCSFEWTISFVVLE